MFIIKKVGKWLPLCRTAGDEGVIVMDVLNLNSMI